MISQLHLENSKNNNIQRYEILEKLYPKKNNIVTTWAARVSIQVDGEWKMIEQGNKKVWRKGKHVLVGQPKFSRNYLVENAVNTKSIDEFSDLFQSDSQTNNPRALHGENNVNLTTKKRKLENDTEPNNTPKKSRIEGVVPSSLIDERVATRNSHQSTSSSDTTVDNNHTKIARQVRCLMSAIESQLTQKTLEMERTRAEYNRLHDQIQELQRRKELLEQIA